MSNPIIKSLPDAYKSFAFMIARGVAPKTAAVKNGFSEKSCYRLLSRPEIALAVRAEVARLLTVEAAPTAYRVLLELARDTETPPAVRRACARDLLDRAGFVPPKATESPSGEKPLSEMSSDELRALVDRLESELGARAVDVTPSDMSDNAQGNAQGAANGLKWNE